MQKRATSEPPVNRAPLVNTKSSTEDSGTFRGFFSLLSPSQKTGEVEVLPSIPDATTPSPELPSIPAATNSTVKETPADPTCACHLIIDERDPRFCKKCKGFQKPVGKYLYSFKCIKTL
jgi:hypothetical protein